MPAYAHFFSVHPTVVAVVQVTHRCTRAQIPQLNATFARRYARLRAAGAAIARAKRDSQCCVASASCPHSVRRCLSLSDAKPSSMHIGADGSQGCATALRPTPRPSRARARARHLFHGILQPPAVGSCSTDPNRPVERLQVAISDRLSADRLSADRLSRRLLATVGARLSAQRSMLRANLRSSCSSCCPRFSALSGDMLFVGWRAIFFCVVRGGYRLLAVGR